MLAPKDVKTYQEVDSLQTSFKNTPGGYIHIDGGVVFIIQQDSAGKALSGVSFDRRDFNRIARWYNQKQRTKSKDKYAKNRKRKAG